MVSKNQNPEIDKKRIVQIKTSKGIEAVVTVSNKGVISSVGRAIKLGKIHNAILTAGQSFPNKETMRIALSETKP